MGKLGTFLEAIPFQPKDKGSPVFTKNGERNTMGIKSSTLHSANTLLIPGVETFIWMIAWMRGSSLGIHFSHACDNSYLEEAIAQQEGFHLHLLFFPDEHHSGLHIWEEAWVEKFIGAYIEQCWRLLMRRPQEKKGEKFCLSMQLLEDKQHVGGEDCNVTDF